jgi:hypothetical protein
MEGHALCYVIIFILFAVAATFAALFFTKKNKCSPNNCPPIPKSDISAIFKAQTAVSVSDGIVTKNAPMTKTKIDCIVDKLSNLKPEQQHVFVGGMCGNMDETNHNFKDKHKTVPYTIPSVCSKYIPDEEKLESSFETC